MISHRSHSLPSLIATAMAGTMAVFALTLTLSVLWMSRALDRQAQDDSARLVTSALSAMGAEMLAVNLEYSRWDDLVMAISDRDGDWLYTNVGITTASSVMTDLAVIWGGGLGRDLGWLDQSPPAGLSRLAPPQVLAEVDRRLGAEVPIGTTGGVRFFTWRGNDLFAASATRIEWSVDLSRAETEEGRIPRLLMGRRIANAQLADIGGRTLVKDLRITRRHPGGRAAQALPGADGAPVAWLSWTPPSPGTALLRRMLPVLLPVAMLATGLGLFGMILSRRSAHAVLRAQAMASAAAHTDAMTGLPNRAAFNLALSHPARAGERGVLFLDVNGFKRINDSLGHAAGDEVVTRLARRLESLADPDCLLARIGGDEFVFVVTGPNAQFRTEWLAHAAEKALAPSFTIAGHRLQVQAAMGHAVQSTDGMTGEELVRRADLAMYESKRRQDPAAVAFGDVVDKAGHDARTVERALREALQRPGEIWMAYQPVVAAQGRRLLRAEALARWTSPELGSVPPDSFIAVAERAGLIGELGRRILYLVCDDLAANPRLRVSINVSPLQLIAPDFVQDVLDALGTRGIDPSRLEVELTESVLVDDPCLAARRIRELHEAGISTALDDFGTGFSSIGTLRQLRFDALKIDRSFVTGLAEAPERLALVNAMMLLAHALGLRVVCEGVETEDEFAILRDLGCDLLQGYAIERPLPIAALSARWLAEETAAVA